MNSESRGDQLPLENPSGLMHAAADGTAARAVPLTCPTCDTVLGDAGEQLACPGCGARYPIVDGIPRLVQLDFYWGEIAKSDAQDFVAEAKRDGWRAAVANRFSPESQAWISILDWQRTSWTPLLGLPRESVVLDVGSGYGAITHSLAANYDEVHSVEVIPERVEFTKVRVEQEGLRNVHLAQASALHLPYPPASFDLIVVNGVLEWIGDWDLEGSPRSAQLRFLRRVAALLKPTGQLVVGIENRFGYGTFMGAIDHSGLPYTNLMPRWMASVALQRSRRGHHRMEKSSRTYRTYTYSERGYRHLFSEAGFMRGESYSAEPGYNQPYRLTPLNSSSVGENLDEMELSPAYADRLTFRGRMKRWLAHAGLLKYMVGDFLFILRRSDVQSRVWEDFLPSRLKNDVQCRLTTSKFGAKTTIRVYNASDKGMVLKCSTPAPGSPALIAMEYSELEAVASMLRESAERPPFAVPAALGTRTVGRHLFTAESRAPGEQLSITLFRLPAEERFAFVRDQLPALGAAASAIASAPVASRDGRTAESWLAAAKNALGAEIVARAGLITDQYSRWSAHGDFTIENIICDAGAPPDRRATIIDWEYVREGVPPIYDLIVLAVSILRAITLPKDVEEKFEDPLVAQFYAMFFHRNQWSELIADVVLREANRLGLDRSRLWEYFIDTLIYRVGYLVERKAGVSASRIRFCNLAMRWKTQFQL